MLCTCHAAASWEDAQCTADTVVVETLTLCCWPVAQCALSSVNGANEAYIRYSHGDTVIFNDEADL